MKKRQIKKIDRKRDFTKKRNIFRNNIPKEIRFKESLEAGDGILPKAIKNKIAKKPELNV